jgi:hypothetical protein
MILFSTGELAGANYGAFIQCSVVYIKGIFQNFVVKGNFCGDMS